MPVSKNPYKKHSLLALTLIAILILTACGKPKFEDTRKRTNQSTTSSQTTSTEITTEASTQVGYWSKEKEQQLDSFIEKWGPSFSPPQFYVQYTPEKKGDFYGVTIPDDLITPKGLTPDFNGEIPRLYWSTDGNAPAGQYALVATYSDIENSQTPSSHLYLFTIKDGKPQVWISEQNQGNPENKFYFRETKNEDLRNCFVSLITSGLPTTASPRPASYSTVDTKNLSTQQCSHWARAHKATTYGAPYTKDDFIAEVIGIDKSTDGLVYIDVRENHDSPTMRAAGAAPNVASSTSFYRINATGQLELMNTTSGHYFVVASIYYE